MTKAQPIDDIRFLRRLSYLISCEELHELSQEGGFQPPNSFEFNRFRKILATGHLPQAERIEYSWALRESGVSRLIRYTPQMRIFISCVFYFCNAHEPLGLRLESDFYWLGVKGALDSKDREIGDEFLGFLQGHRPPIAKSAEHEIYFYRLAICVLHAWLGDESLERTEDRLANIMTWIKGKSELQVTDSSEGLDRWRAVSAELIGSGIKSSIISALP